MYKFLAIIFLTIFLVISVSTYAKDFGKIGETYPIKEVDLLDFIQTRLKQMQQNGELEKINKRMIEKAKLHFDRPNPIKGITTTKVYKKWFIDPSIKIENDIVDVEGRIIAKAGTVINPLKQISLRSAFIFYDGDNKSQVTWAIKQNKLLKGKVKLILINGSIIEQVKILKKKIFFDQHGRLINKFKIQHTPAIVAQEGLQMKVEEVIP